MELRPAELLPKKLHLDLRTKVAYGSGAVASGVALEALAPSLIILYLNQVVGLSARYVGLAVMISLIVDAVIDPLIGQWSDETRSRWGRRHPFMYASALPCALFVYLLWHAPPGWTDQALFAFVLAMLILLRISVALYEIPSAALAPEIAPGYHDRTGVFSYRLSFRSLGAAAMLVLLYTVFLRKDATHPLGVLNKAGYEVWGTIAAVAMPVFILLSAASTRHLIPYLSERRPRGAGLRQTLAEMVATLTNPSLLVLMVAGLASGMAQGVTMTLNTYFNLHYWGIPPQLHGLFLVFLVPSAILGAILAPAVTRRLGKRGAILGLLSVSLFTSLGPIGLRLIGLMPANDSPWLYPLLIGDQFINAGLVIMGYVILASMIADVVEDGAVRTQVRSEGLLFAANGLLPKVTSGIGAFIASMILEAAAFPVKAQQGTVEPGVLHQLALLYLPILFALNASAIVILSFYRIDRATHERNLALLSRAQGGASAAVSGPEASAARRSPLPP